MHKNLRAHAEIFIYMNRFALSACPFCVVPLAFASAGSSGTIRALSLFYKARVLRPNRRMTDVSVFVVPAKAGIQV